MISTKHNIVSGYTSTSLRRFTTKVIVALTTVFALAVSSHAQEVTQTMYNELSSSELSVLKNSRNQVLIYELVNIQFDADNVNSREFLKGFTALSNASEQRLNNRNSYQDLLVSNRLSDNQSQSIMHTKVELMLNNDEIAALHNRIINISQSFIVEKEDTQILAAVQ